MANSGFRLGIYVCKDAEIISRARILDAGRMITAGGITSGMEMGFHLLRRAGYAEEFLEEVARVMEYSQTYQLYRDDVEVLQPAVAG